MILVLSSIFAIITLPVSATCGNSYIALLEDFENETIESLEIQGWSFWGAYPSSVSGGVLHTCCIGGTKFPGTYDNIVLEFDFLNPYGCVYTRIGMVAFNVVWTEGFIWIDWNKDGWIADSEQYSHWYLEWGEWHHLKIDYAGTKVVFYIDNNFPFEVEGIEPPSNVSIVITGSHSGGVDIDNAKVGVMIQEIPAAIDIEPDTLNLRSQGRWITAYIELPNGYDAQNINVGTIMLEDTVPAEVYPAEIGDHDFNGTPDLMVKFDRSATQTLLKPGYVELTVTGRLTDGTPFEGSDIIRVI